MGELMVEEIDFAIPFSFLFFALFIYRYSTISGNGQEEQYKTLLLIW